MGLADDTSIVLNSEYEKLHNLLIHAQNKPLLISEIIELYYQVMSVSSLSFVLKSQSNNVDNILSEKLQIIENEISDIFNSKIHLQITKQLTDMVQNTMKTLSSDNPTVSKTEIQSQSHLYDILRQQMSTREFVEQYDRTLSKN